MSKITSNDISALRAAIWASARGISPALRTMVTNLTDALEGEMLRADKAEELLAAETKRADDNKDSWKRWEIIAERTMDHQASVITQLGIRAENAEKSLQPDMTLVGISCGLDPHSDTQHISWLFPEEDIPKGTKFWANCKAMMTPENSDLYINLSKVSDNGK